MGSPTRLRRPLFDFLRAFVWFKEHRNKNSWEADWIGGEWSNPGRRRLCVCGKQSQRQYFRTTSCPPRPAAIFGVAKFSPVLSILHADFTVIQDYRASLVSFVISSGVWVRNTSTSQPSHSLWNIHSGHTFGSLFDADQDPANTFLNELFFTGFSVHFGDWYRAITCSLVRFFHTLRSCVVAGESQTCHRFVFARLGDLPEAKPIGGRIAAINFMIISLRSSDCSFGSSDRNHG